MKITINYTKVFAAILLISMGACKSEFDNITIKRFALDEDQSQVLQGLADIEKAIITDWSTFTDSLKNSTKRFIASPSANTLADVQTKWKQARDPWESNESFGFGPVGNDGIDGNTDDWPMDINSINSILASNQTLNAQFVSQMATNTRGFHAIEYLLFGRNGAKTFGDFSTREYQLINLLVADLKSQSDLLKTRWIPNVANSFYDDFKNGGQGNSSYPTAATALAEVLGAMTDIMTELPDAKIEDPLTKQSIDYLESRFSDYSYHDFRNNITGVLVAYSGKYGNVVADKSISNLVAEANPAVNDKVLTQFKLCLALYDLIQPASMNQGIFTRQNQLRDLQDELRKLNQLLSVDVTSVLGIGE
ncbi:MAG: hypothetical protein HY015_04405 [Bacteroidetes bacterium]|nr:hypothetical protein [Bacteroidota bacterium]MBI3482202.1 hypothetical protein [Bacteroidota bacterium]